MPSRSLAGGRVGPLGLGVGGRAVSSVSGLESGAGGEPGRASRTSSCGRFLELRPVNCPEGCGVICTPRHTEVVRRASGVRGQGPSPAGPRSHGRVRVGARRPPCRAGQLCQPTGRLDLRCGGADKRDVLPGKRAASEQQLASPATRGQKASSFPFTLKELSRLLGTRPSR